MFLTQYFNLEHFLKTDELDYTGMMPGETLIVSDEPIIQTFVIEQENLSLLLERFIDLANFSVFNFGNKFTLYSCEFPPVDD